MQAGLVDGLGLRPDRAAQVLTTCRALGRRLGVDPSEWGVAPPTDEALVTAFATWTAARAVAPVTVRNRRVLVRAGLRVAVGAGPGGRGAPLPATAAARRWPRFWLQGRGERRLTRATITTTSVLPATVYRAGPQGPWWTLFQCLATEARLHSGMHRPGSLRLALVFWDRFLREAVVPVLPTADDGGGAPLPDAARLLEGVASTVTAPRLVEWYGAYRRRRPPVRLPRLVRDVHLLSLLFHTLWRVLPAPLRPPAFGLPDPRAGRHPGGTPRSPVDPADWLQPRPPAPAGGLAERVRPPGPRNDERVHTFDPGEIRALYLACETPFERVLCTALLTTGMRVQGFCTLERPVDGRVGDEVFATEKGHVRTPYAVSPVLRALLQAWLDAQPAPSPGSDPSPWCFPGRDDPVGAPISTSCARYAFTRVARRAGVVGPHVHPHTCRHTVSFALYALGNTVDQVAGFVGHRNPQVTLDVYIALSGSQRRGLVRCPWLHQDAQGGADGADPGASLRALGRALAEAIASPFGSPDGRTFPTLGAIKPGPPPPPTPPPRWRTLLDDYVRRELGAGGGA